MYKTGEGHDTGQWFSKWQGSTILPPRDTWQPLETLLAVSPGAAPGLSGQSAGMFLNSTVQGTPPNREFTAEAEKHCSRDSYSGIWHTGKANRPSETATWSKRQGSQPPLSKHPQSRAGQTLIFICGPEPLFSEDEAGGHSVKSTGLVSGGRGTGLCSPVSVRAREGGNQEADAQRGQEQRWSLTHGHAAVSCVQLLHPWQISWIQSCRRLSTIKKVIWGSSLAI